MQERRKAPIPKGKSVGEEEGKMLAELGLHEDKMVVASIPTLPFGSGATD